MTASLPDLVWTGHDRGRTALVENVDGHDRTWTRGELWDAVLRLAGRLTELGGPPAGEPGRVAVALENGADFLVAYHAVLAAGGSVVPLDPRGRPGEWAADLRATGSDMLVTDELRRRSLAAHGAVVRHVLGPTPIAPVGAETASAVRVIASDRIAVLAGSSGSQGRPHRVALTHRNLVANLDQIEAVHRLRDDDVVLCVPPLRHIYGMQMAMNPALRRGVPLVLTPTPLSVDDLLDRLARHRVTVAYLVPSVIAELAARRAAPSLPHLRLVVSGGAPLPAADARRARELLGAPVVQGFGMTEVGCLCFSPDGVAVPEGSVGVLLPGTEARIVDPAAGTEMPPGEAGELWVRGPQIAAGHLAGADGAAEPAVTPLTGPDGWLRTGDLVRRDADGFVTIAGRLKSMIKYKGHQVAPAELEAVLTGHPAVRDAVVAGAPDPVAGEIPVAFVVLRAPVAADELRTYVAERVAPHKRIRRLSEVAAIPRADTGKVAAATLRRLLAPPDATGLRVVVTGGGRGLGLLFAGALLDAGAHVLLIGRDTGTLARATHTLLSARGTGGDAGDRLRTSSADVTDPDRLAAALAGAGPVDVLVNNAAVPGPLGPAWAVDADDWWRTLHVGVGGALATVRLVVPGMIERCSGRVINVVSRAGRLRWPHASAYSVAKAALAKLTENLDAELRGTGVRALGFDPGLVDAGMTHDHLERGRVGDPYADTLLEWALAEQAAGGFTAPADAAARLVRLAVS